MKILITGGAGFIGSHVAKALLMRGDDVVILDDFNDFLYPSVLKQQRLHTLFENTKRPRVIAGSILNEKLVSQVFEDEHIDKVLHCAALANPGVSVESPEGYAIVNIVGTLNLLIESVKHDIVQFVFAGSSSVYNDEQTPFKENQYPLRPRSPYGASKAAAEQYCTLWHDLYGLPMTILRFFSVYGPWGRPDMAPYIFAERILRGRSFEVTADRKRDFTYIDDVVKGIVAALDHRLDCEIINIGRGQPLDLNQFIEALEKAANTKALTTPRTAPPGEMRVTYADISKAKELLGYEPTVSVEEGAARLMTWVKTQL